MPYNQSLDLLALAAVAFDKGDSAECDRLVKAAFQSSDLPQALDVMLSHNENIPAASITAADVGVVFEQPGEQLRITPGENQRRLSQEDSQEDSSAQDTPSVSTEPVTTEQPTIVVVSPESLLPTNGAEAVALSRIEAQKLTRRIAARRTARMYFEASNDKSQQAIDARS